MTIGHSRNRPPAYSQLPSASCWRLQGRLLYHLEASKLAFERVEQKQAFAFRVALPYNAQVFFEGVCTLKI